MQGAWNTVLASCKIAAWGHESMPPVTAYDGYDEKMGYGPPTVLNEEWGGPFIIYPMPDKLPPIDDSDDPEPIWIAKSGDSWYYMVVRSA